MTDSATARRLRLALDMYEVGEHMLRSRLRRERPRATDQEVEREVRDWRLRRPGAPLGDAVGRPLVGSDERP